MTSFATGWPSSPRTEDSASSGAGSFRPRSRARRTTSPRRTIGRRLREQVASMASLKNPPTGRDERRGSLMSNDAPGIRQDPTLRLSRDQEMRLRHADITADDGVLRIDAATTPEQLAGAHICLLYTSPS